MKKHILMGLMVFSNLAFADGKNLIAINVGCPDYDNLKIYEYPDLQKGVRVHSPNAEFEIVFDTKFCGNYRPEDQNYCHFTEGISGRFPGGPGGIEATLLPNGYDLDLSGEFQIKVGDGRICRYQISKQ